MAIIELKNINKIYGDKAILNNFSLDIEEGDLVSIVGNSGSGKTTILNIIGLLEKYESGSYTIDGDQNIKINSSSATKILKTKINYLFQNFALIDEESVEYNLRLALKYVKGSKHQKDELIKNVLSQVGLDGFQNRKVYELSGGEQQRVSIARCILKPGKIILADEPTGSLDRENVEIVLKLLKKLNNEGKTVIIVTHDQLVADSCARVVRLK